MTTKFKLILAGLFGIIFPMHSTVVEIRFLVWSI